MLKPRPISAARKQIVQEIYAIYPAVNWIENNNGIYSDKIEGVVIWKDSQSAVPLLKERNSCSYSLQILHIYHTELDNEDPYTGN